VRSSNAKGEVVPHGVDRQGEIHEGNRIAFFAAEICVREKRGGGERSDQATQNPLSFFLAPPSRKNRKAGPFEGVEKKRKKEKAYRLRKSLPPNGAPVQGEIPVARTEWEAGVSAGQ